MSNVLKRQGKIGAAQVIENHLPHPAPALRRRPGAARPTPRGGLARQEGLPPSERPSCLSGLPRAQK